MTKSTDFWLSARAVLIVAAFALPIAGCNSEQKDWEIAQKADSEEAYSTFLTKHHKGPLADRARSEIELQDWKASQSVSTVETFQAFLAKHPEGARAEGAKKAIDTLERQAKLRLLLTKRDLGAIQAFLADETNAQALDGSKTVAGKSFALVSQPEQVLSGYRMKVKASSSAGAYDVSLVVSKGAPLNVKPFGFADGLNLVLAVDAVVPSGTTIAKGSSLLISKGEILSYLQGLSSKADNLEVSTRVKETSSLFLASEFTEIGPDVLLRVSDSEILVAPAGDATLQRKSANKEFFVSKGAVYLLKLP